MRNPWTKAASLEEASRLSGLLFPPMEAYIPVGMENDGIYWMNGLIEVRFRSGSNTLILRKSTLPVEHLSGDYNRYPSSYILRHNGLVLLCKGTADRVNVAEFSTFGAHCSICCNIGKPNEGLPKSFLLRISEGMAQLQ